MCCVDLKLMIYPKVGGLFPVAGPTQRAAPLSPEWLSQPPGDAVASRHIAPRSESDSGTHTQTKLNTEKKVLYHNTLGDGLCTSRDIMSPACENIN